MTWRASKREGDTVNRNERVRIEAREGDISTRAYRGGGGGEGRGRGQRGTMLFNRGTSVAWNSFIHV